MYMNIKGNKFKDNHSINARKMESQRVVAKYPDRSPIICLRGNNNVPEIDKIKYLVPSDITLGQFTYVIRKRIKLSPEVGLYLFINNKSLLQNTTLMGTVYKNYKDEDGFLYVYYSGENTFGNNK